MGEVRGSAIGIGRPEFASLAGEYDHLCRLAVIAVRNDGATVYGTPPCPGGGNATCREARRRAVEEAVRWGEPTVDICPGGHMVWAAPLLTNSRLRGGIVASVPEERVWPADGESPPLDIRRACTVLRQLLEKRNLTNADLLENRRRQYQQERVRAEAIHHFKSHPFYSLRETYLQEEPMLLAAVRRGDLREARRRINHLLVAMLHQAGGNLELTKSYFMELLTTMCRNAVEAGGDARELLGSNYGHILELATIRSEEALAGWLNQTLEHILGVMHHTVTQSGPMLVSTALRYMEEHLGTDLSREEVAAAANLSPSHLSRMFRQHVGRTFVDTLNRMRVDRAAEYLTRSDKPLTLIALEVGYHDQSYFTKVFRRYMGVSPGRYRKDRSGLSSSTA